MSRAKCLAKFQNLKFWQFFKIRNFDFVLFWLGIWCESLVWVIMGWRGVSQNAGVLVVLVIPPEQRSCWGVYWFQSVRLSVRLSVRPSVRLSRLPCPLCNIYSSGWILSILATNDQYYERMCRTHWPLTLTYFFKVIWPWLRKSCPLCCVYSSGWILFIYGTNDHYH